MLVIAKKSGQRMAVFVAALFLAAVFQAIAPAGAVAAPAAGIYSVDMAFLVAHHPDAAAAGQAIKDAAAAAEKEFNEKAANMNANEQTVLFDQLKKQLDAKAFTLMSAIQAKVAAAVQEYATEKGLPVVIEKGVAIYSSVDITAEVGKKINGK
ncbi:OmpH family outer membrane protein [Anaeroselena agilis]|uniref:OmpH family outer membrane protein n=1 Tax=Anaeroselena agilis TaxID=3063788 RepID=A0ABU3NXY2_9FIRM|nr:OmpH family outer membrane protein [Selenomonadales bacterium 4137-cl]